MKQPESKANDRDQPRSSRPDGLPMPSRADNETEHGADHTRHESKPHRVVARVLEGSMRGPMVAKQLFPADDPAFVLRVINVTRRPESTEADQRPAHSPRQEPPNRETDLTGGIWGTLCHGTRRSERLTSPIRESYPPSKLGQKQKDGRPGGPPAQREAFDCAYFTSNSASTTSSPSFLPVCGGVCPPSCGPGPPPCWPRDA